MNFCPEFVVVQSALELIARKSEKDCLVGNEKSLLNVQILTTAIREVIRGLDQENEQEEQDSIEQNLHNLLFLKLLQTHYKDDVKERGSGDLGKDHYSTQTVLCGILPAFSKCLYYQTVMSLDWLDHLSAILRNLDGKYINLILNDIFLEAERGEKKWCIFLLNYITSCIVIVTTLPNTNTDDIKGVLDLLNRLLCLMMNEDFSSILCTNMDLLMFLTVLCDPLSTLESLQKWFRYNVMGKSEVTKTLPRLHAYFLDFGIKHVFPEIVLDLNVDYIQEFRRVINFGNLAISVHNCLDKYSESWIFRLPNSHIAEKDHEDHMNVSLCTTVLSQNLQYSLPSVIQAKISAYKLLHAFESCTHKIMRSSRLSGIESSETEIRFVEQILQDLRDMIMQDEVLRRNLILEEEASMPALLWRINHRQPGYQSCLSRIIQNKNLDVWEMPSVLSCLTQNKDLMTEGDTLSHLYDVTVRLHSNTISTSSQVKQLTLSTFEQLPEATRVLHIARIYKSYGSWPQKEEDFVHRVNSVLNKLTSQHSNKLVIELHCLALENAEMFLYKAIERVPTSIDQADIILKILQNLADVCRTECHRRREGHPCNLLDMCILQFLEEHALNSKEQKIVIYFLSCLMKPTDNGQNSTVNTTRQYPPLLLVQVILKNVVLPNIKLPHLQDNNQPVTVTFAFDLGVKSLEILVECFLSGNQNLSSVICDLKSFDFKSSILCFAELLHDCVIPWRYSEVKYNRLNVKEKVVQFVEALQRVFIDSKFETGTLTDDWLLQHLLAYDWTVQIFIAELIHSSETSERIGCDLIQKILNSEERVAQLINIMRFATISDAAYQLVSTSNGFCQGVQYEELQFCLVQILPNLTIAEWRRSLNLVSMMIQRGDISLAPTMSIKHIPLVNLNELHLPLSLSQILHDVITLLPMSGIEQFLPAVNHSVRTYVHIVKTMVLIHGGHLSQSCHTLLLLEVYLHVVKATCWVPEECLDTVSILLLDLVCKIEEMTKALPPTSQGTYDRLLKDVVGVTSNYIQDDHTRNMVRKIADGQRD